MDLFKMLDPNLFKELTQGAEEFGKNIRAILGALMLINKNLEEIKKILEDNFKQHGEE